jgi:hypothetical protein
MTVYINRPVVSKNNKVFLETVIFFCPSQLTKQGVFKIHFLLGNNYYQEMKKRKDTKVFAKIVSKYKYKYSNVAMKI